MSKNNFLSIFSMIASQKWNFPSFYFMVNNKFFVQLSIILIRTNVVEIWQSATVRCRWLKLGQAWGMNWQTYWGNIKIMITWVRERFNFHYFFISCKTKMYNSNFVLLKSSYFHQFLANSLPRNWRKKG